MRNKGIFSTEALSSTYTVVINFLNNEANENP